MMVSADGTVLWMPAKDQVGTHTVTVALSDGKAFVVARRDGKPEKVPVEVIASSGAEALVIGVANGEEIAADAALAEAPVEAKAAPERKP
jgi:hypothetical protein